MSRRTATLVWAAMLVVPFAFAGVVFSVARGAPAARLREPLFWLALLASALNVALARALPPRLGPARADDRDAVAFTRVLVSLALAEAAALSPLVVFLITHDPRLFAVLAVDLVALAVLFPSEGRWATLLPAPHGAGAPRWGGR